MFWYHKDNYIDKKEVKQILNYFPESFTGYEAIRQILENERDEIREK